MGETNQKYQRALTLMLNLEKLREESFQCDFEVRIEGKQFPVHRSVLAASSKYFKAMLKSDMKEANQGYVEVKELDVSAVKDCLDYLYSGEIDLNFDQIEPILKASDMMQLEDLKALSFSYMMEYISTDNCLQIRHYAMMYNSEKYTKASGKFVAENFAAVLKTEQFQLLEKEQLQECLILFKETSNQEMINDTTDGGSVYGWQRNVHATLPKSNSMISTKTQWQAIANWVGFNKEERGEHLLELLKSIEPYDVSAVFSNVLADPFIPSRQDCVEFLVNEVVLAHAHSIRKYISVGNCFNLKRWAKQYNSDELKIVVHNFMVKNFDAVANSEQIEELDSEEIRAFLFDEKTKRFGEEAKYEAIIRWTRGSEAERMQYFEELFGLLNLSRLPPEFIHNTVRKEPLVKSHPACNEKIMDALFDHTQTPSYGRRY